MRALLLSTMISIIVLPILILSSPLLLLAFGTHGTVYPPVGGTGLNNTFVTSVYAYPEFTTQNLIENENSAADEYEELYSVFSWVRGTSGYASYSLRMSTNDYRITVIFDAQHAIIEDNGSQNITITATVQSVSVRYFNSSYTPDIDVYITAGDTVKLYAFENYNTVFVINESNDRIAFGFITEYNGDYLITTRR